MRCCVCDTERLFNTGGELHYLFAKLTKERRIGLVATDEAHLVQSWSSFNLWSCKSAKIIACEVAKYTVIMIHAVDDAEPDETKLVCQRDLHNIPWVGSERLTGCGSSVIKVSAMWCM